MAALRRQLEQLEARTAAAKREFAPAIPITRERAEELKAIGYVP